MEKIIEGLSSHTWFRSWFDSRYYHQLYQHRDENEAVAFIDELLNELSPSHGSSMLDAGCGTGRHSRYLAAKGFTVTGFDLASSSITQAKRSEHQNLHFYQHDMQLPFGNNTYDYIFSFFTSFGYFKNRKDNSVVIKNMSNALKAGGTLLIDYLNVPYVDEHIVPVEEKEIDGVVYHINRWSDESFIYKRIAIYDGRSIKPLEYVEQVARFSKEDFNQMLSENGLEIKNIYGDYQLQPYVSNTSNRMILLAEKIKSH